MWVAVLFCYAIFFQKSLLLLLLLLPAAVFPVAVVVVVVVVVIVAAVALTKTGILFEAVPCRSTNWDQASKSLEYRISTQPSATITFICKR